MSSLYDRHKVWVWIAVWVLTRAFVTAQIGFFHGGNGSLEDVFLYEDWSEQLSGKDELPFGELWQYPPGAAYFLLLPRLGLELVSYGGAFVGMMLLFDLAAFVLIAWLGRREGSDKGVWVWLLGVPMLRAVPLLRFDLVGTTFAVAALVVIHRRPGWFGALAGLGAMVKAWPIVLLFGEWDRRRLLRACLAAAGTAALVFAVSAIAFKGDVLAFLTEQNVRGLQVESVASVPWHLREVVTGEAPNVVSRSGTAEIASGPADTTADLLKWATLAVLVAAAGWWVARARAIRAGREDLADAAVSRDFVFTLVLLLVVTSRVLSPQFLVWLFGLAAVALTSERSRIARPAWIVIGAAIIATGAYGGMGAWGPAPVYGSGFSMVVRSLALGFAAIDASLAMFTLLRRPPKGRPEQAEALSEVAPPDASLQSASGR